LSIIASRETTGLTVAVGLKAACGSSKTSFLSASTIAVRVMSALATRSEVQELLEELKRYFPNIPIQEADIISTYAGVRPLYCEPQKSNSLEPGKVSRHSKIIELPERVFNLPGGKLTNARFTAEVLLKQILKKYFPNQAFSSTQKIDYGFARYRSLKKLRLECLKNSPIGLAPEILELWISRYGSKVLHFLNSDLPLNKICEAYPFRTPLVLHFLIRGVLHPYRI
jgi:glycerol-3-phosphate dehydrogenase